MPSLPNYYYPHDITSRSNIINGAICTRLSLARQWKKLSHAREAGEALDEAMWGLAIWCMDHLKPNQYPAGLKGENADRESNL